MVDLVKIRKKGKSKGAAEQNPAPAAQQESAPPAEVKLDTRASAREPERAPTPKAPVEQEPVQLARPASQPEPEHSPAKSSKLERFKEQAGRRRSGESFQEREEESTGQIELLTFVISGEQYAVDIERIVEIVTPRVTTRIPNADATIVGIISLRGTIVTLVDVRRKLRHPQAEVTPDSRVVVVDFRNETVGFVVDRVLRVVKTSETEIEPHPVVHVGELEESIRGVFRVGGALTILLDLDKLLDHTTAVTKTA